MHTCVCVYPHVYVLLWVSVCVCECVCEFVRCDADNRESEVTALIPKSSQLIPYPLGIPTPLKELCSIPYNTTSIPYYPTHSRYNENNYHTRVAMDVASPYPLCDSHVFSLSSFSVPLMNEGYMSGGWDNRMGR